MTCASTKDLFAFVQSALPTRSAEVVRQHLIRGCEECNHQLRQIQKVLSVTDTSTSGDPPKWSPAEGMHLIKQRETSGSQTSHGGIRAVLLVDTGAEGRLLGFRGTGPVSRHLLYRAGDYDIDLSMDYVEQTRLVNIMGQSLPLGEGLDAVAHSDVKLLKDSIVALATKSNEFGEFILDGVEEGVYDLRLILKDGQISIIGLKALAVEH